MAYQGANQNLLQPNNDPITVRVPNLEKTLSHGKADLSIGLVSPSRVRFHSRW